MTGKSFYVAAVALLALGLSGCARTVSPNGYVSETPVERYVRNLPTAYAGQRHVVLKPPPAPMSAAPAAAYAPPVLAAPAEPVSSYTLEPPDVAPVTPPLAVTSTSVTTTSVTTTAAPMAEPAIRLHPPAGGFATREVDYGDHVTIYPLDGRDAAMPYIPPAHRAPVPLATTASPYVPGYNP